LRELGVLCQKAIARMNRFGTTSARSLHDSFYPQIAFSGRRSSNLVGFVAEPDVKCVAVSFRVDGNWRDAQITTRPRYPHGDLTTIGN
jgi:hypothetical protein